MEQKDASDTAITSILEALYNKYGYDFRQYAAAHVRRRIVNRLNIAGLDSPAQMRDLVLSDKLFAARLVQDLSIAVTEMFRDPPFYKALREKVIPLLKTYPFLKIWHAGCSTGEEAYSMAILLTEEGLYDRTTIYATDFNERSLAKAKDGIFPAALMKEYTANYQLAGGKESFASYYTSSYDGAIIDQSLKKNIVWANHNLVTDRVFAEVHLVMCRNVLIYFNRNLQNSVQQLLYDSLVSGGILCLGTKEHIRFSGFSDAYAGIDEKMKIYKKKY